MRSAFLAALLCLPAFGQTATVHFYRFHTKIAARLSHPTVYCDGGELARIETGSIYTVELPAGKHFIISDSKRGGVTVELEPGKEYYFRLDLVQDSFVNPVTRPVHEVLAAVDVDRARVETEPLHALRPKWVRSGTCGK